MCKWCDENKIDNDFISYEDEYASNKSFLNIGISEGKLYADTESVYEEVEIKFCPFCGRELESK